MPTWNETNKPYDASEVLELEIKQCSQLCSSIFPIKKRITKRLAVCALLLTGKLQEFLIL